MTQTLFHPGDADLLRYIDGELSRVDAQVVQEHLPRCADCQQTVDFFSASTSEVEMFLRDVSIPVIAAPFVAPQVRTPQLAVISKSKGVRPWYARTSLRAALVVFGIGGATLAVSPVRGWVVDLIRNVIQSTDSQPDVPSEVQPPVTSEQLSTSSVAFVPERQRFEISVAQHQGEGVLTIVAVNGTQARGSIVGSSAADALMVTGSGLSIQNSSGSQSSYRVQLPPSVRQIVIRISNNYPVQISRNEVVRAGETTVSLSADASR